MKTSVTQERRQYIWVLLAIFAGSFCAVMSSTAILVPLPHLMNAFHTDLATITWTVTGFKLAQGVIAPVTGFLCDRLTARATFLWSLAALTLVSVVCAFAPSVWTLNGLRFVQGLCAGVVSPVSMALIYQYVERPKQPFVVGMWSMSGVLAPTIAPTIAGFVVQVFGWQWLFFMNVPMLIFAIAVTMRFMPKKIAVSQGFAFDWIGFVTGTAGSAMLLVAFSMSQSWGLLAPKTLGLLAAGVLVLVFFVRYEMTRQHPMLQLGVLRARSFAISVFVGFMTSFILMINIFLLPLYLQIVRGFSPVETGLIVMIGPIAVILSSFYMGKMYRRTTAKFYTVLGAILSLVGYGMLATLQLDTSVAWIMIAVFVFEIGLNIATMATVNYGMEVLSMDETGHGSAIMSWIVQGTSALTTGLAAALLIIVTRFRTPHAQTLFNDETLAYHFAYTEAMQFLYLVGAIGALILLVVIHFWMRPASDDQKTLAARD